MPLIHSYICIWSKIEENFKLEFSPRAYQDLALAVYAEKFSCESPGSDDDDARERIEGGKDIYNGHINIAACTC